MRAATRAKSTSPMLTAFFQAPRAFSTTASSGEPSSLNSCSGESLRARKMLPYRSAKKNRPKIITESIFATRVL